MEHGSHLRQSELVEQSHEAGPETADRRWARDEKSGDVSDGRWRKTVAAGSAEPRRLLGSGVRLARDGVSGVKSPGTLHFSPVFEVIGRLLTELVKVA
jgi:hypothetical protein